MSRHVRVSSIGLVAWLAWGATATAGDSFFPAELASLTQDDWPCWRGPRGDNVSPDPRPPIRWGAEQGVIWKTAIPGRGHASPCVVGQQIILASADEAEGVQFLLALNRQTGAVLWRTDLHKGSLPRINAKNSHASATPACDGRQIYAAFAQPEQLFVTAVDLAGERVWQKAVGKYKHANGLGASPVLFRDLVIVASDNPVDPVLVALRRSDGEEAWRTPRRASENSATPIIGMVAGRPQLLINGAFGVNSYDPATGEELWHVDHNTEVAACTMAFDDQRVVASGNVPEPCMMAVRGDGAGAGALADDHVLWKMNKSNTYVPSPLLDDGRLFVVIDGGVAFCREPESGEVVWQRRLGGNFSASPVLAGGNVYATSEEGVTHVFRAADEYERVAENDIGATCLATPVFCGGRVYLRSDREVYCIGADSASESQ